MAGIPLVADVAAPAGHPTGRASVGGEVRGREAELEEQLARQSAELAAARQELEAFTHTVAHDLRAPLHQIMGFTAMLADELGPSLDGDARRHLDRVLAGAERIAKQIDALAALARLDRAVLRRECTDLAAVATSALEQVQLESPGRVLDWRLGPMPSLPCDPRLVRHVFMHLFSNAVKFTRSREPGVIEIGTVAGTVPPVVCVRDNGVGFDQRYAGRLFGMFQRLHRQEDFEGLGVGLATVRRIVHRHGGRVWAESRLNESATFFFTLSESEQP